MNVLFIQITSNPIVLLLPVLKMRPFSFPPKKEKVSFTSLIIMSTIKNKVILCLQAKMNTKQM